MMLVVLAGLAGGLALIVVDALASMTRPDLATLPWAAASSVLMAATLAVFARRSRLAGVALAVRLLLVTVVIGPLTELIEAAAFEVVRPATAAALFAVAVAALAVAVPVIVVASGTWRVPARPATAPGGDRWLAVLWRGALAVLVYVVCYITAGLVIFPYVKAFYATKHLPSPLLTLGLQVLLRGPLFVAAIVLLLRALPGSRGSHALVAATAMAILAGVVPLLVPNPFLPDAVRWVHFCEVVTENFVFGAFTGWLLSPARAILRA